MQASQTPTRTLPLFPLGTVLFPGGLLRLKVFEARYLDLMSTCLRQQSSFGVVSIRQGAEVRRGAGDAPLLASMGCEARLLSVDMVSPGLMQVRCEGMERFHLRSQTSAANGLIVGEVEPVEADPANAAPQAAHVEAAKALASALKQLRERGLDVPTDMVKEPFRFTECGWIANRWCELLPLPLAAKQQLLELLNPALRLDLVDQFLRRNRIIGEQAETH
jgi:Lon protease-like protein